MSRPTDRSSGEGVEEKGFRSKRKLYQPARISGGTGEPMADGKRGIFEMEGFVCITGQTGVEAVMVGESFKQVFDIAKAKQDSDYVGQIFDDASALSSDVSITNVSAEDVAGPLNKLSKTLPALDQRLSKQAKWIQLPGETIPVGKPKGPPARKAPDVRVVPPASFGGVPSGTTDPFGRDEATQDFSSSEEPMEVSEDDFEFDEEEEEDDGLMDVEWDDLEEFDRLTVYRKVIEQVWADGKVTQDELNLIRSMRMALDIGPEDHLFVEREVLKGHSESPDWLARLGAGDETGDVEWDDFEPYDRLQIYNMALGQAWEDGKITQDEAEIIISLQNVLGITIEEHDATETDIKAALTSEIHGDPTWASKLRERLE